MYKQQKASDPLKNIKSWVRFELWSERGETFFVDGCQYEKDNLETNQHESACTIAGLTLYTSLRKKYIEIGWLSLENGRLYQKIVIAYKVKYGF